MWLHFYTSTLKISGKNGPKIRTARWPKAHEISRRDTRPRQTAPAVTSRWPWKKILAKQNQAPHGASRFKLLSWTWTVDKPVETYVCSSTHAYRQLFLCKFLSFEAAYRRWDNWYAYRRLFMYKCNLYCAAYSRCFIDIPIGCHSLYQYIVLKRPIGL